MATATERIPVLVTASEKARIARKAKAAELSVGEYMRRAASAYRPAEDEAMLEAMIEQMLKTTEAASRAIDEALAYVEQSNERIARMEAQREARAA